MVGLNTRRAHYMAQELDFRLLKLSIWSFSVVTILTKELKHLTHVLYMITRILATYEDVIDVHNHKFA